MVKKEEREAADSSSSLRSKEGGKCVLLPGWLPVVLFPQFSCRDSLEGQAASKNGVAVTGGAHFAGVGEEEGHLPAGPRDHVDGPSFFSRLKRGQDDSVGVPCVFSLRFVVGL